MSNQESKKAESNVNNEQGGAVADTIDKAKETARTLVDQARSTASGAYEAAADKTVSLVEERKAGISEGITGVADTVRRLSETLNEPGQANQVTEYAAKYTDTAASKLEQAARYFEATDLRGMARDLESYARRNPAVFLGGAFALGIVAARFLKSSPPAISSQPFNTAPERQLAGGTQAGKGDRSEGQGNQTSTRNVIH